MENHLAEESPTKQVLEKKKKARNCSSPKKSRSRQAMLEETPRRPCNAATKTHRLNAYLKRGKALQTQHDACVLTIVMFPNNCQVSHHTFAFNPIAQEWLESPLGNYFKKSFLAYCHSKIEKKRSLTWDASIQQQDLGEIVPYLEVQSLETAVVDPMVFEAVMEEPIISSSGNTTYEMTPQSVDAALDVTVNNDVGIITHELAPPGVNAAIMEPLDVQAAMDEPFINDAGTVANEEETLPLSLPVTAYDSVCPSLAAKDTPSATVTLTYKGKVPRKMTSKEVVGMVRALRRVGESCCFGGFFATRTEESQFVISPWQGHM